MSRFCRLGLTDDRAVARVGEHDHRRAVAARASCHPHDAAVFADDAGTPQAHPLRLANRLACRTAAIRAEAVAAIVTAVVAPAAVIAPVIPAAIVKLDADARALIAESEIDAAALG